MKIFVSIASYRDPLLKNTIIEAYNNARFKSNLIFGVCDQNYIEQGLNLNEFSFANQIKYIRIDPENTKGVCYARSLIQSLHTDEDYYFQIDSHTLFDQDWDSIFLNYYIELNKYHNKPLITTYPHNFEVKELDELLFEKLAYSNHQIPTLISHPNHAWNGWHSLSCGHDLNTDKDMVHGYHIGACCIFTSSNFINDVPYDMNIFFGGEESSLTLRAWTNGYNIFHVKQTPIYHCWARRYSVNIFNDNTVHPLRETTIEELDQQSQKRLEQLFTGKLQGPHGVGAVRSIKDYCDWSGINYIEKTNNPHNKYIFDLSYKNSPLIDHKRFNLGFFGSHNASFAISQGDTVLEVLEVERLINVKNAALFWWGHHDNIIELLTEVKTYFENKYNVSIYENVIYNSLDKEMWKIFPAKNYKWLGHHEAHAYSALYQSPYKEALIISFDGGSDQGFFNIYRGLKKVYLNQTYAGNSDYAVSYMVSGHHIQDIKQEDSIDIGNFVYAGKLMGLAGYGKINEQLIKPLKNLYLTSNTDLIRDAQQRFLSGLSFLGLTDESSRIGGDIARDIAATNQHVFEDLFYKEIKVFLDSNPDLPVILVGGCALNIINNTRIAALRDVFVPPNPNDCGQAIGLLCSEIQPGVPVDCTYIGPEVWDRNLLSSILHERRAFSVDIPRLVSNLINGKIYGIVQGRCEHGPRALGHRSIICDPTISGMKDTLNLRVKGREYYRPFAPVVRLEDVNKYFEWDKESRHMSFCPKVKTEYQSILREVTHVDGTARVQTVTRDQNEFLYNLLTEMHDQKGIGVLLNTSFNIAGKPILNTYKDALWMLDNKDMDGLILETYFIEKH